MWRALSENAAEWSLSTLIMYLIAFTIVRFGVSIRLSIWRVVCLFFAALLLTTACDAIFEFQNGGLRLFDAEPLVSLIPNVFSVPFMASLAVLFLAAKYWSGKGEA
ncbi:hypothetical protein [Sphingorhabdus sp. EL138]|uniref:hypothetical protein n=1 Tax=Sphingorhabdus sp. EL138 TaxID=2073156 RepID=UPI0025DA4B83|nr:hypothetical protein [Sphingorhabdus sp. EL138]